MSDLHSTRSRNRPSRVGRGVLAVLTGLLLLIGAARAADTTAPAGGEDAASALAKKAQNPIADLISVPIITANWSAPSGNHWTVPVGGGGGKLWRVGKVGLPVNTQVQEEQQLRWGHPHHGRSGLEKSKVLV
mgnify:CR=1 FL=1